MAQDLVKVFVELLIGIALAPVVYSFAVEANVSGTVATLLALVPLFFVILIIYRSTKSMT